MKIIPRKQAREEGLGQYYTGVPCIHGHYAERKTSNAECIECRRIKERKRRQTSEYKAKKNARRKAKYDSNPDYKAKKQKQARNRYRDLDPEKKAAYIERNAERTRAMSPEERRARDKRIRENKKEKTLVPHPITGETITEKERLEFMKARRAREIEAAAVSQSVGLSTYISEVPCKKHGAGIERYALGRACTKCQLEKFQEHRAENPIVPLAEEQDDIEKLKRWRKRAMYSARKRAKKEGYPFDEAVFDELIIPSHCPVLGIPVFIGRGKISDNSPTIDKINPAKGYVKGNVSVISNKANRLKSDMGMDELIALKNYLFVSTFEGEE